MRLLTVVETPEYLSRVGGVLAESERRALVDHLAANPLTGDVIPGTGGARKLRWGAKGKGKRGGARVITFYGGPTIPVFLLAIFAKGEKIDLTAAERNELKRLLSELVATYRKGVERRVKGRR